MEGRLAATVPESGKNQSDPKQTRKTDFLSMPNMTGRPGCRRVEMNGGSSASYLACTPCIPLFSTLFNRGGNGNRRVLDYQGRAGITSIVRWNPRPVIFGVDLLFLERDSKATRMTTPVWISVTFEPLLSRRGRIPFFLFVSFLMKKNSFLILVRTVCDGAGPI